MPKINRATLVKAKPWLIGAAMVGLFAWNMKQCSSLDKEQAANQMQDDKIARVDSVVNSADRLAHDNNKAISDLIKAIGATNSKVDNNSERIGNIEERVDSLSARIDSVKPCPCKDTAKKERVAPVKKRKKSVKKKTCPAESKVPAVNVPAPAPEVQQNISVVGINNGTVNNYYNAPAPASENSGTVKIKSSASVTTTYVVTVQKACTR